ncbi:MAG: hypothetical protein OXU20_13765 [Myxococcales bacterium]|nr:hypothetical protein [Myxococcales bacterium]
MRFDCFDLAPHYHLGWSYRDESLIEIDSPDPFEWTMDALKRCFGQFVQRAGGDLDLSGA